MYIPRLSANFNYRLYRNFAVDHVGYDGLIAEADMFDHF